MNDIIWIFVKQEYFFSGGLRIEKIRNIVGVEEGGELIDGE